MRAVKLILACAASAVMAGCAVAPHQDRLTQPQSEVPAAEQAKVAQATAEQINKLWLPAKTTFALAVALSPKDAFGNALVENLRQSGTGIVTCFEYREGGSKDNPSAKPAVVEVVPLAEALGEAKKLTWDFKPVAECKAGEPCLYRVTVHVDSQVLGRAYEQKEGVLNPVGVWSLFSEE